MTTSTHLTQCPACQHTFNITDEQLGLKSGYARCGNCQKIFSAIDNIISQTTANAVTPSASLAQPATPAIPPAAHTTPVAPTAPLSKAEIDKSAADELAMLFDDHLGLDEAGTLVKTAPAASNPRAIKREQPAAASSDDFDIIDNFDSLPTSPKGGDVFESTVSSNAKDSDNEAWLNELLEEDNKKYQTPIDDNKLTTIQRQDNDVTHMLEEFGVGVKYETAPSENEYQQKLEQRLAGQVASQRRVKAGSTGMTAIWAIGSLLLGVALWAQYIFFNFNDLIKDPSKVGQVSALCSVVQCKMPLADTNAVEVSTLTINTAKGDAQKTDLVLVVKNKTQQSVLFPNLKFTLRQGNQTKAQFVLTPKQYVDDSTTMLSGQIEPIKLRIDYPKSQFEQANIDVFY